MRSLRFFRVSRYVAVASSYKNPHVAYRMNTTTTIALTLSAPELRNDVLIPGSILILGNILALVISL